MWNLQQHQQKSLCLFAGVTFLLLATFLVIDIVFLLSDDDDDDDEHRQKQLAVVAAVEVVKQYRETLKRRRSDDDVQDNDETEDNFGPPRKKKYIRYDRERAQQCVMQDYLGPTPIFDDRQFEQIFCITRSMYERIRCFCCSTDSFFTAGFDCTGRHAIYTDVKILAALKKMAYGVSGSAFRDYFQMGESTVELCCERLAKVLIRYW